METIYTYTREEAINDGVLSDAFINKCAQEIGIKWHCACTARLHAELMKAGNNTDVFFYDLVFLFKTMILLPSKDKGLTPNSTFTQKMNIGRNEKSIKIVFSEEILNDELVPCWTFMNPNED